MPLGGAPTSRTTRGSPGRGPQAASQAFCSARTASRSRHRSSGVTQCGWAGVPPVTASSAAASRRADGGAPPCRTAHASRIASSISRSVTLFTSNRHQGFCISSRLLHLWQARQYFKRAAERPGAIRLLRRAAEIEPQSVPLSTSLSLQLIPSLDFSRSR